MVALRKVEMPEKINLRELVLRSDCPVYKIRGDIFDFAPKHCDGCALWLGHDCNRLISGWDRLARRLQEDPERKLYYLQHYQWFPFQNEDGLWRSPYGKLLKIKNALEKLSYLYVLPDIQCRRLYEPAQARRFVMNALEILNDAGVKEVAMNGIHGDPRENEKEIAKVMVDAACDWPQEMHRSDPTIERIFLVDLRGGFNAANVL